LAFGLYTFWRTGELYSIEEGTSIGVASRLNRTERVSNEQKSKGRTKTIRNGKEPTQTKMHAANLELLLRYR